MRKQLQEGNKRGRPREDQKIRKRRQAANGDEKNEFPLTVSRKELLVGGADVSFRDLIHGMLAFSARVTAIRGGFAKYVDLTGAQYPILVMIGHLERRQDVSVQLIADRMHLSGAFVTIETGKLLKRRLITKSPDGNDRRRVRLQLTEKGWALLHRLAPVQRQVNDVLFESLSAEDFRRLCDLLPKLVASADRALRLVRYHATERQDKEATEEEFPEYGTRRTGGTVAGARKGGKR